MWIFFVGEAFFFTPFQLNFHSVWKLSLWTCANMANLGIWIETFLTICKCEIFASIFNDEYLVCDHLHTRTIVVSLQQIFFQCLFSVIFLLIYQFNLFQRHKTTKMSRALKLKHVLFNQAQIVYFLGSLLSLAYTYIVVKFPPEMFSLILFMLNIFLVEKRKCLRWMNYGNDRLLLRKVSQSLFGITIVIGYLCKKSLTTHTSHLLSVCASVNK